MARGVTSLVLAAALLGVGAGCRHCNDPCRDRCGGWFSSRPACAQPTGRLVGRDSCETCVDPATGMPLPGYTVPGTLMPGSGGVPGGPPDMLPYPAPSPLIPPAGVPPYATPAPAPGGTVGTLPPPRSAVPVSGGGR